MATPLTSTELRNGITVVRVHEKKLYQNAVPRFREEVLGLVDRGRRLILIDLTGVEVMNSSALGVIILVHDRLSKEGGRLALCGLSPILNELFQRMHLGQLFPMLKGEEEGLALLSGQKNIPAK